MNKQPLLILSVCFILGIFFQDRFSITDPVIYSVVSACVILFISTFFHSYLLCRTRAFLLGLLFFGLGICLHYFNTPTYQNLTLNTHETVVFKISKKLNSSEKNKKYEAVAEIGNQQMNAVIYIPKDHQELDFNHYYKAAAYISKPQAPEHDFVFNYAQYLQRKSIYYQIYIRDGLSAAARKDLSYTEKIQQKRLEVLKKINRSGMSAKSQEFLKGIILADRTEIDAETVQDFNRSGLVHFLAISGTHVVVIFGMLYFFLMQIIPARSKKIVIIISLGFIWLFALFIGFGNSVLRSCIMLSVYFTYVLLQRKPDLLHSLALSALIILAADTHQIYDVGFQLSFLAVLGIFWLNQPILNHLPRQDNYFKKLIYNTVSISIAAQLATLPLVLYYFHQFSLVSVIANFVIVPFSELIIIFSFLMTGFIAWGLDLALITSVYDVVILVLLKTIHWFADFDTVFFENIPMNLAEVTALFVMVYFLRFVVAKYSFRNIARFFLAVLVFFSMRISFSVYENHRREVLMHHYKKGKVLSVKKGSAACFWIENPHDSAAIRQYIINPYISSRRIKRLTVTALPKSATKIGYHGKMYNLE